MSLVIPEAVRGGPGRQKKSCREEFRVKCTLAEAAYVKDVELDV
jgi:hypothetical protein